MEDTSNVCTFTFKQIQTVFSNNPEFDSPDLEFFNQLLLLPIQSHHDMLRRVILKYFKTSSQPNCYAIGFAFFIYRTNKQFFLECNDWSDFNTIEAHVTRHDVSDIFGEDDRDENDDKIYCICGHRIIHIYITEYKNQYCMMGSECIEKCKIKSMQEDFHTLTHYTCSSCNREYQQSNGKIKKTICGNCSKPVEKKQITYYDCYGCNNNYKVQYDDQHFCGRCDKKGYYDKERIYNEKSLKYCPYISPILLHKRRYPIDTVVPTVVPTIPTVEHTIPTVEHTIPVVVPRSIAKIGPVVILVPTIPRIYPIDDIIFCHGRNMFVEASTCKCC
jgi:hypothetical protein